MIYSVPVIQTLFLMVFSIVSVVRASPVLVLIANGSDITINFPGENNNNHVFSVVSASGNNNPSMLDWIGGNGANKAPTINLGKQNSLESSRRGDDSSEDDRLPSNLKPIFKRRNTEQFYETDSMLPWITTITEKNPTNSSTILTTSPDMG